MTAYKGNQDKKDPSEGELFIAEYLDWLNIKYYREFKIDNLVGDSKFFRVADFYLPKLKLYIEFFGMWNHSKESRERYREKREVFRKNNIPCVFLYPENLGTFEYTLIRRVIRELKQRHMHRQLFRFRFFRLWADISSVGIFMFGSALALIGHFLEWYDDKDLFHFAICVFVYQLYRIARGVYQYFYKDRFFFHHS